MMKNLYVMFQPAHYHDAPPQRNMNDQVGLISNANVLNMLGKSVGEAKHESLSGGEQPVNQALKSFNAAPAEPGFDAD